MAACVKILGTVKDHVLRYLGEIDMSNNPDKASHIGADDHLEIYLTANHQVRPTVLRSIKYTHGEENILKTTYNQLNFKTYLQFQTYNWFILVI